MDITMVFGDQKLSLRVLIWFSFWQNFGVRWGTQRDELAMRFDSSWSFLMFDDLYLMNELVGDPQLGAFQIAKRKNNI